MNKKAKRNIRHLKVRKKVVGSKDKPRLVVFRSNKNIYAQIIDDQDAKTLAASSSVKMKSLSKSGSAQTKKINQAEQVGQILAQLAIKKKITNVVFDRGGNKYHGRIKALADGAKKGGLKF